MFSYPKKGSLKDTLKYDENTEHVTCLSYKFIEVYKPVFELVDFYPVKTKEQIHFFKNIVENYRKGKYMWFYC